MGCEGFNSVTEGTWTASIDGDYIQVVDNGKTTWTGGVAFEYIEGNKTFQILGPLEELFVTLKLEQVIGRESKFNAVLISEIFVGGKFESTLGVNTEIHIGPKYQVGVAGQTRVISENQLLALERQQLINAYKEKVGAEYQKVTKLLEEYGELAQSISDLTYRADKLRFEIGHLQFRYKDHNMHCSAFTHAVGGDLKIEAATVAIKSKGAVTIEGTSVEVDGGGGKVEVAGKLSVNGQDFTCL